MDSQKIAQELVAAARELTGEAVSKGAIAEVEGAMNDLIAIQDRMIALARKFQRQEPGYRGRPLDRRAIRAFAELWDSLNAWKIDMKALNRAERWGSRTARAVESYESLYQTQRKSGKGYELLWAYKVPEKTRVDVILRLAKTAIVNCKTDAEALEKMGFQVTVMPPLKPTDAEVLNVGNLVVVGVRGWIEDSQGRDAELGRYFREYGFERA